MGSVVVRGGQQQGSITSFILVTAFFGAGRPRQFDQYKVCAYVKGDTAWIVGDWQGTSVPDIFLASSTLTFRVKWR